MTRFDPTDEPYGVCACGVTVPNREALSEHWKLTGGGAGHSTKITNPTRAQRIENELEDLAQSALSDFVNEAEQLLDEEEVTEEEITEALRMIVADPARAWAERNKW